MKAQTNPNYSYQWTEHPSIQIRREFQTHFQQWTSDCPCFAEFRLAGASNSKVCPLPHFAVVHGRTSNRQESSIEQFCKNPLELQFPTPWVLELHPPNFEGARALEVSQLRVLLSCRQRNQLCAESTATVISAPLCRVCC